MKLEQQVVSLELAKQLKDIEGYERMYQVSTLGEVYSLAKFNASI